MSATVHSTWNAEAGAKQANNQISWSVVSGHHQGQYTDRTAVATGPEWQTGPKGAAVRKAALHVAAATTGTQQDLQGGDVIPTVVSQGAAQAEIARDVEVAERGACQRSIASSKIRNLKVNTAFQY